MIDLDRRRHLAEVALLYYDDKLTQSQIAARLGVSRSSISRLLDEAKQEGIVEIVIHYPWRTVTDLAETLKLRFGLTETRVLSREGHDYMRMTQGLGNLAARYLTDVLGDGSIIAIGWGTATYQTIVAMKPMHRPTIEIVQMLGASGSEKLLIDRSEVVRFDGPRLAQMLAQAVGGRYRHLPAPLLVENWTIREALLQERNIREVLDRARQAHIALVGVGSTQSDLYSLFRAGYVTQAEMETAQQQGAVGDICVRHFNLNGQVLDIDLNRRVVGISLEELKQIGCVIGVAGGRRKATAILGALRGGYINILITDDRAAREILRLDDLKVTAGTYPAYQRDELN